jgi:anthranilate synthase/aminodeoxychorismate synthase-like glutamine amidotransferase
MITSCGVPCVSTRSHRLNLVVCEGGVKTCPVRHLAKWITLAFVRVLVLDNYDSFTYNIVQYLGELGAEPVVRRNDEVTAEEIEREFRPAKILISPGPGAPREAGVTLEVVRHFAGRVPLLGVCLGHQAIGEAFGGRVVRAPAPVHGKPAAIEHDGRTIFAGLSQGFRAGRYHSLVVERESVPACLEISATTPDGLVMGLRHREYAIEGVQFHPESIITDEGRRLLANFLRA